MRVRSQLIPHQRSTAREPNSSAGGTRRGRLGALGFTSSSQILSTLSNFAITVLVARTTGVDGLGQFAVAFSFYLTVLGFARALISDPLLASNRPLVRADWNASATLTVMIATTGGVCSAMAGWALGRPALFVVSVALPITLLQDLMRYQAFQAKRPGIAVVLDVGWVAGIVASWPVLIASSSPNVAIACWGGSAALGPVLALSSLRLRFSSPGSAIAWWRREARDLALPMLADSILYSLFMQAQVFALTIWAGNDGLGLLRAAQILFGPLTVLLIAVNVYSLPQLAQKPTKTTVRNIRTLICAAAGFAILSCGAVLVVAPVAQPVLFGDTTTVPLVLLVPVAAQVVCTAVGSMLIVVAKARRDGRAIASSRFASTITGIGVLLVLTSEFGAVGAAWALVVQTCLFVLFLGFRVGRPSAVTLRSAGRSRNEAA